MATTKTSTKVVCGHPERKHNARGLCKSCFNKRYKKSRERAREHERRYREKHRKRLIEERKALYKKQYATTAGWLAVRAYHLKRKFGLSLENYEALLSAQGGVCAICKRPETVIHKGVLKHLAVDHCHQTGKNRGLLCQACNHLIGHGKDRIELLKAAISYLESHQ